MTPHERYELLWRELELADDLKFDYGFSVEHHFSPQESWMSAPSLFTAAAAMRTKHMKVGPMGYVVPLYNSLRLAEEIAILDQMLDGRFEIGLVPGINQRYFEPFGLDYDDRKTPTIEYIEYLRAAYGKIQPFSFEGQHHVTKNATLSVQPVQRPHPPIWMQSRDPETLEFCAKNGLNTGYFVVYPRKDAAPRYLKFIESWNKVGWPHKPNIGYSTLIYVDKSDKIAIDKALKHAAHAYEGFLPTPIPGENFKDRVKRYTKKFEDRGEDGAAVIMANIFNPEYLMENDLVFIGSPETIIAKLHKYAQEGVFNTFMGEFNFAELEETNVMNSIRLFGEKVIPALRDFEPF